MKRCRELALGELQQEEMQDTRKVFRGATSVTTQLKNEHLPLKIPGAESLDDFISTDKDQLPPPSSTHFSPNLEKADVHPNNLQTKKDQGLSATHKEDTTIPLTVVPCNLSNKLTFCKTKLGLDVDYDPSFLKVSHARSIFNQLEEELETNLNNSRNEVVIMGKVHKIPRKQTAFGDPGLMYEFSGVRVSANPWIPLLESLRDLLASTLGEKFNFVLVNQYKDGLDHIGEHRDDERDLAAKSPIAALSLGQSRDFVFKHRDARGSCGTKKNIDVVKVCLDDGSLLVMKFPTNVYWYHSLPVRRSVLGARISLTFRIIKKH